MKIRGITLLLFAILVGAMLFFVVRPTTMVPTIVQETGKEETGTVIKGKGKPGVGRKEKRQERESLGNGKNPSLVFRVISTKDEIPVPGAAVRIFDPPKKEGDLPSREIGPVYIGDPEGIVRIPGEIGKKSERSGNLWIRVEKDGFEPGYYPLGPAVEKGTVHLFRGDSAIWLQFEPTLGEGYLKNADLFALCFPVLRGKKLMLRSEAWFLPKPKWAKVDSSRVEIEGLAAGLEYICYLFQGMEEGRLFVGHSFPAVYMSHYDPLDKRIVWVGGMVWGPERIVAPSGRVVGIQRFLRVEFDLYIEDAGVLCGFWKRQIEAGSLWEQDLSLHVPPGRGAFEPFLPRGEGGVLLVHYVTKGFSGNAVVDVRKDFRGVLSVKLDLKPVHWNLLRVRFPEKRKGEGGDLEFLVYDGKSSFEYVSFGVTKVGKPQTPFEVFPWPDKTGKSNERKFLVADVCRYPLRVFVKLESASFLVPVELKERGREYHVDFSSGDMVGLRLSKASIEEVKRLVPAQGSLQIGLQQRIVLPGGRPFYVTVKGRKLSKVTVKGRKLSKGGLDGLEDCFGWEIPRGKIGEYRPSSTFGFSITRKQPSWFLKKDRGFSRPARPRGRLKENAQGG